ncbi:S8/S53 family peptidase [Nocardioides sp. WS12]|uniref:S8 family peptidase n=1 Tax=Nocardioides sp. WS12 TaxID=2486272 RepID=UPI0015FC5845|nr:S8/S53 family peptidase [Nocardioides sp. WS12]
MDEPARPGFPIGVLRDLIRKLRFPFPDRTPPDNGRPKPDKDLDDHLRRVQVGVIRKAFEDTESGVSGGPVKGTIPPTDDADVRYLYRPGHALIRQEDFGRLRDYFTSDENKDRYSGELGASETRVPGLVLAKLPSRVDKQDDVLATLGELEDQRVIEPGAVCPDHIVYVTIRGSLCPASEPEMLRQRIGATPWPPATPSRGDVSEEERIRVAVVDTGLWTAAVGSAKSPWLESGEIFADATDEEHVNPNAIHEYAGHGTFVAGVVRCMAPDARVEVEGVLTHGGAVYESEIVQQLQEAIDDDNHPQIISISAGTHTRGDFAPLGFEMLNGHNKFARRDDIVIVAAAGNDASSAPFWPAAFDWVVSVGSVDADGKVSDFSNHGKSWVDVYARGRNHVNAFPKGTYKCYEPPNVGQIRKFDGLAQWSGTSFSTPLVSGLIAAHMQATGDSARKAADIVIKGGTPSTDPRVGPIVTVGPLT